MIIYNIFFYLFSFLLIVSAIGVVSIRNTVYSVLLLIFAFFNAAGLFLMMGAEFLAMALIIVYVGAVAVLFLFVVMMLNINVISVSPISKKYKFFAMLISGLLFINLAIAVHKSMESNFAISKPVSRIPDDITNTKALGMILYTDYSLAFEVVGLILLIAMIGAIVLTYRKREEFVKKQNVSKQLMRNKNNGLSLMSVKVGEGVDVIGK